MLSPKPLPLSICRVLCSPTINPAYFLKTGIGVQWMMGDALLISPVLNDTEDTVNAYFPDGEWLNLYDHSLLTDTAGYHVLTVWAFPCFYITISIGKTLCP